MRKDAGNHIPEDKMIPLLDGLLEPDEEEEMWQHMEECIFCAKKVNEIAVLLQDAESVPSPSNVETKSRLVEGPEKRGWSRIFVDLFSPMLRPLFTPLAVRWVVVGILIVGFTLSLRIIWKDDHRSKLTLKSSPVKVEIPEVKAPLVIKVSSVDDSLYRLSGMVRSHGGKVLRVIFTEKGARLVARCGDEKALLKDLKSLGDARIPETGYKTETGNIVIYLKYLKN